MGGSEGEPVMVVSTVASDTLDSFSRGVMALLMILPPLNISPARWLRGRLDIGFMVGLTPLIPKLAVIETLTLTIQMLSYLT